MERRTRTERDERHGKFKLALTANPTQLAKEKAERDKRRGKRRLFELALTANRTELADKSVPRDQMADNLTPEPDPDVTDVVFVIHGIRDKGYWTQKIARAIKKRAAPGQKIEFFTESYGYFAMLPFLFYTVRKRKVEWLMDRYAEARTLSEERVPLCRSLKWNVPCRESVERLCSRPVQIYRACW